MPHRNCRKRRPSCFPDEYQTPKLPLAVRLLGLLPLPLIQRIYLKDRAPKHRPLDALEVEGSSPYQISEIKKDFLWKVEYTAGGDFILKISQSGCCSQERFMAGATCKGDLVDPSLASRDWEKWTELTNLAKKEGREGIYKRIKSKHYMYILKLEGREGSPHGLLLFNPVVVHDLSELDNFIHSLGAPVRYIVTCSAAHTNCLPEVIRKFPDAITVGPVAAQEKLNALGTNVLPSGKFSYTYTNEVELGCLNEILQKQALRLVVIDGDVMTQTAVLHVARRAARNLLLTVDVLHKHHDACGCGTCTTRALWTHPDMWGWRVYYRLLLERPNSPLGALPTFRFLSLDPSAPARKLLGCFPPAGEATCGRLARALRGALALEFGEVWDGHLPHPLTGEDFRRNVDFAWGWLVRGGEDGGSPQTLVPSSASPTGGTRILGHR